MVSAHMLAKLLGRTLLLHWNVNVVSQHAFKLRQQPGVALLDSGATSVSEVAHKKVKNLYLFHMMYSHDLGDMLELLGCSDLRTSLQDHPVVTISSNLYFAPMLGTNPNVPAGTVPEFPQLLHDLFTPS